MLLKRGIPTPEAAAKCLEEQRAICDRIQREFSARQLQKYPVTVEDDVIADVPVRIFTPTRTSEGNNNRILINCHGGGFTRDAGSMTENIPIAFLTGSKVVAVRYRLAPEHCFQAQIDDVISVYKEILRTTSPAKVCLYGTSAGAILSARAIAQMQTLAIPVPTALGFFSGAVDFNLTGDSEHFFPLIDDPRPFKLRVSSLVGNKPADASEFASILGDLSKFPATLCVCGTRDLMLSQTSLFHRALLRAGVDSQLVVFEAMPHAHWSFLDLPESDEAFQIMSDFFEQI